MTDADLDLIAAHRAANDARVSTAETSIGRVIVKRERPARRAWRGRALAVLRQPPRGRHSRDREVAGARALAPVFPLSFPAATT